MSTPLEPLPDCYEGDPDLLPAAEALRRIHAHLRPIIEIETINTIDALGRVSSADIRSPFDVPGHTNSAMDGYAVDASGLPDERPASYRVVGTAMAGHPFAGPLGDGEAVRIMTGAVMPEGADTVVMQEHAELVGDAVLIGPGHTPGQNVRAAGEDIALGSTVLEAGTRIMPAEMGLIASLGISQIEAFRRLRVAYFSTGDEVLSPGDAMAEGLVYDSNRFTVHGMLERIGAEIIDLGIIPDRRDAVREAFREGSERADVVLSSGGASAGEADYIKDVLGELGQVGFWRIAIRPGRPLAFGFVGDAVFFGLPGNPVAVMVTFLEFVRPALRSMAGERSTRPEPLMSARTATRLRKKPGRIEYYRAVVERDAHGMLHVRATGKTGSGLLHTMSDANCFIVLPEDGESVEAGSLVDVQPFFGLL